MQKKTPHRIVIFSLAYHPYLGGAEVAIDEITRRIAPEDIEFSLICAQYNGALPRYERIGNVAVYRVGFGKNNPRSEDLVSFPWYILSKVLYPPLALYRVWKLNREKGFSGAWVVMAYAGLPLSLGRLFGFSIPYALTLQEGDTPEVMLSRTRIRPFRALLKSVFVEARVVHAISHYLAHFAREMGYQGVASVIPNGVSVEKFQRQPEEEQLEEAKAAIGKTSERTLLITTSRLVEKNAVDTVVRALPRMDASVHFAVLGEGPMQEELEALSRECGVEERVHFLGFVPQEQLPAYYHAADIFIRPSRSEGQGNSFIEAFASGLPVIATQVGGIADFLYDSERNPSRAPTGFVVDPDAPEQIAAKVEYIINHPSEVAEVVERALRLAQSEYEWESITKRIREEVLAPLLEEA